MSVKIAAVFVVLLGEVISQDQKLVDIINCRQSATVKADTTQCFKTYPVADITSFTRLQNFFQSNPDCSATSKIPKHYTCVVTAERKCITDERWFTLQPNGKANEEAFTYYCKQTDRAAKLACFLKNSTSYLECVSAEEKKLNSPTSQTLTFEEAKDYTCKLFAAPEPCYSKIPCENTREMITEIHKILKPPACGSIGLKCSLFVLLLSYIVIKLSN